MVGANLLARKGGKILCVKTLGETVKKWREDSGLTVSEFAALVGKKRQNLEQFENGDVEQPRYLPKVAKAIGCSLDDLHARRLPPPWVNGKPPAVRRPVTIPPELYHAIDLYEQVRDLNERASFLRTFETLLTVQLQRERPAEAQSGTSPKRNHSA